MHGIHSWEIISIEFQQLQKQLSALHPPPLQTQTAVTDHLKSSYYRFLLQEKNNQGECKMGENEAITQYWANAGLTLGQYLVFAGNVFWSPSSQLYDNSSAKQKVIVCQRGWSEPPVDQVKISSIVVRCYSFDLHFVHLIGQYTDLDQSSVKYNSEVLTL